MAKKYAPRNRGSGLYQRVLGAVHAQPGSTSGELARVVESKELPQILRTLVERGHAVRTGGLNGRGYRYYPAEVVPPAGEA